MFVYVCVYQSINQSIYGFLGGSPLKVSNAGDAGDVGLIPGW